MYVLLAEHYTLDNPPSWVDDESLPNGLLFNMQTITNMLKRECPTEWEAIVANWKHELFGQYVHETPSEKEEKQTITHMQEYIANMNKAAELRTEEARKNIAKAKKYIRRSIIVTAVNIAILLGHIGLATLLG